MSAQQLAKTRWLLFNRLPLLGGWLRRCTARALANAASPEAVQLLAEALADGSDTRVCALARQALDGLTQQECIDALGKTWAETRSPALAELLTAHQWTASRPVAVRVLCALLTGQEESLANSEAAVVAPLLAAAAEPDARLAEGARRVLRALRRTGAQEAVCRAFLEQADPHARDAALAAGCLPREAPQRALFFFLTEQWQRYEDLDFDYRMLGTLYAAAAPELRARILATLRASGRSDYLPVLTGGDASARAATLDAAEAAVLVGSLAANQEWEKLWPLAFSLPFAESVHILRILTGAGWQPEEEEERAVFRELAERICAGLSRAPEALAALLPPAVPRARVRVAARINDVAFAPGRTELAIGTGRCAVVRWDYQRAAITETLTGLEHSVGRLAYAGNGMLLCGERTNQPDTPCAVYGWENGERFLLEQRTGSITALEPYAEAQVLIAGRDGGVSLWDTEKRTKINARQLSDWPRAACVAPDGQRAALLHRGITLVPLPSLQDPTVASAEGEMDVGILRPRQPAVSSGTGVASCAAFTAGGEELVVGKYTGEVRLGASPKERASRARQPLVRHAAAVKGIEILPGQNMVISAAADGCVQFTDWKERRVLGKITLPGVPLTALHLAPDGIFLALGAADASLSLWDLRPLAAPPLFTEPLARAVPAHLPAIGALLEDKSLPNDARQALEYLACALRHRFRYAIEVDIGPVIRQGEFDIEIEG